MIDYFTLALTHGLMALALWRLLSRPDLDSDSPDTKPRRPWVRTPDPVRGDVSDA
jgi:hypothetical protein